MVFDTYMLDEARRLEVEWSLFLDWNEKGAETVSPVPFPNETFVREWLINNTGACISLGRHICVWAVGSIFSTLLL